ncbi:hypothetical protein D9M70_602720 [compost metagenome]
MRLPMKPKELLEKMGSLPRRRTRAKPVLRATGALYMPRTTSTRRMTLAGLKKCRPMTRWGWRATSAIWSTSR